MPLTCNHPHQHIPCANQTFHWWKGSLVRGRDHWSGPPCYAFLCPHYHTSHQWLELCREHQASMVCWWCCSKGPPLSRFSTGLEGIHDWDNHLKDQKLRERTRKIIGNCHHPVTQLLHLPFYDFTHKLSYLLMMQPGNEPAIDDTIGLKLIPAWTQRPPPCDLPPDMVDLRLSNPSNFWMLNSLPHCSFLVPCANWLWLRAIITHG